MAAVRDVQSALSIDAEWRVHDTSWNGELAVDMAAALRKGQPPEDASSVASRYVKQFGLFDADEGVPPDFRESTLRGLASVARKAERAGVEYFGVMDLATGQRAALSSDGRETLADLVAPQGARRGIGSVTGSVETVGIHGGTWLTVYDAVFGRAVRCDYEAALVEEVAAALGRRFTVDGDLSYNRRGRVTRVAVRALRVLPLDRDLPSSATMAGSMPRIRFGPDGLNDEIDARLGYG